MPNYRKIIVSKKPVGRHAPNKITIKKPVVHKPNHAIDKLKKSLSIGTKPKQIQSKPIGAYKQPAVKQKNPPIHKQLKRNKPIQQTVLNRNYRKIEVKRPSRNLTGFEASRYTDRIKALKNTGNGKVLIMVACGPSVLEVPLEKLVGHDKIDFMVINKPYGHGNVGKPEHSKIWPPKYWVFCDHSQYKRNTNAWETYKGLVINSTAVRAKKNNQVVVNNIPGNGFSRDLTKGYHIGRSSTYANMQVAYWLGYNKIYIFGLDMTEVGGKLHHYGVNPDVEVENRKRRFSNESRSYDNATGILNENERKRFVMCSSYNKFQFVKHFGHLDHKEAPDIILEELRQKYEE